MPNIDYDVAKDYILRFFGGVLLYGGGPTVIAYFIFQFLGKHWIENKFAQALEQLKHQQALEIQRLRIKIDSLLSGVLKIQEKEFETLPEAWSKLDEAYALVCNLVSPVQKYANLDEISAVQLEEFLAGTKLFESQKNEIRNSATKGQTFKELIFWHRLEAVKKACSEFHNYVVRNGIFFPPELKGSFTKVADELWSAIGAKEIGRIAKDFKTESDGWKKVQTDITPLYKTIESDIHARLQSHGHSS